MSDDEHWLRAAMLDDTVVAELLLRLSTPPSSSSSSSSPFTFLSKPLPPSWGARHPRSKPPPSTSSSMSAPPEKRREPRRSPTTPLSWSPSDGGSSSSSLNLHAHPPPHLPPPPPPSDRFRSKISAASDTPTTSSKRCKRKKTFTELKEEESSLLKEQTYLKKELEALHATLKKQRSINVNLKRIKLDMQVESGAKPEPKSYSEQHNTNLVRTSEAASSTASTQVKAEDDASEHTTPAQKGESSSQEPAFVLPDLNMAPDHECSLDWVS